jgi:hypothetical protein
LNILGAPPRPIATPGSLIKSKSCPSSNAAGPQRLRFWAGQGSSRPSILFLAKNTKQGGGCRISAPAVREGHRGEGQSSRAVGDRRRGRTGRCGRPRPIQSRRRQVARADLLRHLQRMSPQSAGAQADQSRILAGTLYHRSKGSGCDGRLSCHGWERCARRPAAAATRPGRWPGGAYRDRRPARTAGTAGDRSDQTGSRQA